ncbi:hypothetical protein ACGMNB_20725 [Shewanella oncorhynchi]|uniref:hypothetical protein n=1 Tax=Shewanella oncorhynchi TaxID=2726434 RepID=UPI003746B0EF
MLTYCIIRLIFVLTRLSPYLFIALFSFNLTACKEDAKQVTLKSSLDPSLCQFSRGDCVKRVGDVELTFRLSPGSAPSEKPLTLQLLSSMPISNVQIRLEGRDMFMGVIPVNVKQTDEMTYIGQMVYGSCSSGYMVWRGFVSFNLNGETKTAVFDFLADDNG